MSPKLSDLSANVSESVKKRNPDLFAKPTEHDVPAAIKRKKGRPEGELQDEIVEHLQSLGYLVAYFRPAKVMRQGVEKYETPVGGDATGFPDLIAVHPHTGAFVVMELKSEEGRVKDDQLAWLEAFLRVHGATVQIVRPSSWKDLRRLLSAADAR